MKYTKLFEEYSEIDSLEDFLLEYLEKWNLIEEDRYNTLPIYDKPNFHGTYKIEKVSTNYFQVAGFPRGESGYRIKICFIKREDFEFNEKEFKEDMYKFITRVSKIGYKYDTYHDKYADRLDKYYIAFFK